MFIMFGFTNILENIFLFSDFTKCRAYVIRMRIKWLTERLHMQAVYGRNLSGLGVGIVRFKTIPVLLEYIWNDSDSDSFNISICKNTFVFVMNISSYAITFKLTWARSPASVVRRACVRACVRPCVNNFFKQHLLWNHLLDFDQTSQEWSLGGPLSKLFKPFQLVA